MDAQNSNEENIPEKNTSLAWMTMARRILLWIMAFGLANLLLTLLRGMLPLPPAGSVNLDTLWSTSWAVSRGHLVKEIIRSRLGNMFTLIIIAMLWAGFQMVIAAQIAVKLESMEGTSAKRGAIIKGVGRLWIFGRISAPMFWLGLLGIMIFSLKFREWGLPALPSGGVVSLRNPNAGSLADRFVHLIMPAITLAMLPATLSAQATAHALTRPRREGEKMPIVSGILIGITTLLRQTGGIVGAAILVETVFAFNGLGRIFFEAIGRGDYPVVIGILRAMILIVVIGRILAEVVEVFATRDVSKTLPPPPEPTEPRHKSRQLSIKLGLAGLILPILCTLTGLVAPIIAPQIPLGENVTKVGLLHSPQASDPTFRHLRPGEGGHLLGTDELGRDIFSRLIYAGRLMSVTGIIVAALSLTLGGLWGVASWRIGFEQGLLRESLADLILLASQDPDPSAALPHADDLDCDQLDST